MIFKFSESLINIEQKIEEFCQRSLSNDEKSIKMEVQNRNESPEFQSDGKIISPVQQLLEAPLFLPQMSSSGFSSQTVEHPQSNVEYIYEVQAHENEVLEL